MVVDIPVTSPMEMGRSIVDIGFLEMTAACYLVYSAVLIFFFVKWFIRLIDGITLRYQKKLDDMHQLLKEIHSMVKAIFE